jgi:FAD/FMN-containing dehydrogenase
MHKHNLAVSEIAKQVQSFNSQQKPFHIYHGTTKTTRRIRFSKSSIVDTSTLSNILAIERGAQTAIVEPSVTFGELVTATLKYGLIPVVVPPFPDITVGGAFAGTVAGSSSFRYGGFDASVSEIEVVLGNGNTVKASLKENVGLFRGSAGGMGTLGFITSLEIRLVPCNKYVKLDYHLVSSGQAAVEQLESLRTRDIDFLDGIMFAENRGVLVAGRYVNGREKDVPVVQFTRPQDPWFFLHAHSKLKCPRDDQCIACRWSGNTKQASTSTTTSLSELVPVYDYLFRYDRGAFWLAAYYAPLAPSSAISRRLMDTVSKSEFSSKLLQLTGTSMTHIMQNVDVPIERSVEFLGFLDARLKIYPLWLCPIADGEQPVPSSPIQSNTESRNHTTPSILLNIGIYGVPNQGRDIYTNTATSRNKFTDDNRAIEKKLAEVGGKKWLYAQVFYTQGQFWDVYKEGRQAYDALREQWGAGRLPSVWDKVKGDGGEVSKDWNGGNAKGVVVRAMLMGKGKKGGWLLEKG